jgi:translation initiation factor IF-1
MRKIASLFLIALLASSAALAHGGPRNLLGTVKEVSEGHMVVISKDGHEVTVHLTERTKYEKAGKAAAIQDVVAGTRVSVKLEKDGKTAATVKIGSSRAK